MQNENQPGCSVKIRARTSGFSAYCGPGSLLDSPVRCAMQTPQYMCVNDGEEWRIRVHHRFHVSALRTNWRPRLSLAPDGSLITSSPALQWSFTSHGGGSRCMLRVCLYASYSTLCVWLCIIVHLCSCPVSLLCALVLIADGQRLAAYWSKCFHKHVEMTYGPCVRVRAHVCASAHALAYEWNKTQCDGMTDSDSGQAQWNTSVILHT